MSRRLLIMGWAVAIVVVLAQPALAQRRGDETVHTTSGKVQVPVSASYGDEPLARGAYYWLLNADRLVFSEPSTMVEVAAVKLHEIDQAPANVELTTDGITFLAASSAVTLVLRFQGRYYQAEGKADPDLPMRATDLSSVELSNKSEVPVPGLPQETWSEAQLVDRTLARYHSSLDHCTRKALAQHLATDDERFVQCVCPIVKKWRLPKVRANLRMHHVLSLGKLGLSLTATPAGKSLDCRVWAGAKPPENEDISTWEVTRTQALMRQK